MPVTFLTGGCHCGAVRYRVMGAVQGLFHCHCSICRRIHGALFASAALIAADRFVVEAGADRLTRYESSPGNARYFCAVCGAAIYSSSEQVPAIRFFTVGTLDGGAHPGHSRDRQCHIFVGSKVPWWQIGDDLPQFAELPS